MTMPNSTETLRSLDDKIIHINNIIKGGRKGYLNLLNELSDKKSYNEDTAGVSMKMQNLESSIAGNERKVAELNAQKRKIIESRSTPQPMSEKLIKSQVTTEFEEFIQWKSQKTSVHTGTPEYQAAINELKNSGIPLRKRMSAAVVKSFKFIMSKWTYFIIFILLLVVFSLFVTLISTAKGSNSVKSSYVDPILYSKQNTGQPIVAPPLSLGGQKMEQKGQGSESIVFNGNIDLNQIKDLFSFSTPAVEGGDSKRIWVFADPKCEACISLEEVLKDVINRKVLQVTYIPTPINGERSAIEVTQTMCASSPLTAWNTLMKGGTIFTPNATESEKNNIKSCANNAIKTATKFREMGLAGTPTIVAADGRYAIGVKTALELTNWVDGKETVYPYIPPAK